MATQVQLAFTPLNPDSLFFPVPIHVLRHIFSLLDVPDHGHLASVCKTFNEFVNSGIEDGKVELTYLLKTLQRKKIEHISFDSTFIIEHFLQISKGMDFLPEEIHNTFIEQYSKLMHADLDGKPPEHFIPTFQRFIEAMAHYGFHYGLNNREIALYIANPSLDRSVSFIRKLAFQMSEKHRFYNQAFDLAFSENYRIEADKLFDPLRQYLPRRTFEEENVQEQPIVEQVDDQDVQAIADGLAGAMNANEPNLPQIQPPQPQGENLLEYLFEPQGIGGESRARKVWTLVVKTYLLYVLSINVYKLLNTSKYHAEL